MTTVQTLIEDAAYQAQVFGQDQTMSSGDAQLILRRLNRMLSLWANERLMVYANTTQTFVMTPSQGQYSTALFTDGRPTSINSMYVTLSNINYPVDLIDVIKWNQITYKLTESIPNNCYYDPTFPNGTLNFYPLPYAAFTCTVDCSYPISGALTIATNLTLPEGYESAIVANLAVDIWPSFKQGNPSESMMRQAIDSKAWLKRTNYQPMEMDTMFDYDTSDISNAFLYKGF